MFLTSVIFCKHMQINHLEFGRYTKHVLNLALSGGTRKNVENI